MPGVGLDSRTFENRGIIRRYVIEVNSQLPMLLEGLSGGVGAAGGVD